MSVLDTDVLAEVQNLLAEPDDGGQTWASGMWTFAEVVGYLNDMQEGVRAATGYYLTRTTLPCVASVSRQDLPTDWIATQRLVWIRLLDGRRFVLNRSDQWELDKGLPAWRQAADIPQLYTDIDTPTLQVQLAPAPAVPGTLEITYIALPTASDGSGIALNCPDELAPGLVWGTIARMLMKEGRAKDPGRAELAQQRYQMMVEATKLLLAGWEV